MKRYMLSILLPLVTIFIPWSLVNHIGSEPYHKLLRENLIIPFLWSVLFIYLQGKKHSYIAANAYAIFLLMLLADILNFGKTSNVIQLSYLLASFFTVFTFIYFYQELFARRPRMASVFSFLIGLVFYALPVFYIIYAISFNTGVTQAVFFAISQSNWNESVEFGKSFISPIWLLAALLLAFLTGLALLRQESQETLKIEKSLLILMIVLFASLANFNRQDNRLYSFAKNAVDEYMAEIQLFKETQKKLSNGDIKFEATKDEVGETYIVVIGESLNKRHMGLYGYIRNTSPVLEELLVEDNSVVFDNVYSSHTHTMAVLSLALTEANQLNGKTYYESLSIVDILKKSGFETAWVTNQSLYGAWDNLVSVIGHKTDNIISHNNSVGKQFNTQKHDGVVIQDIEALLNKKTEKNRVVFVHLMGNHLDACLRYPENFAKYEGDLDQSQFGLLVRNDDKSVWEGDISPIVNCYDNSVLYNDYVVGELLRVLQKNSAPSAFIYMADHADDIFKKVGHNSDLFTFEMTQIPMLLWVSDDYKSRYPEKLGILKKHANTLFPNDFFYDTLIGLFNIKTDRKEPVHDLTSMDYNLNVSDAYTLHKKIRYNDKTNVAWWQKQNIKYLQSINQATRVIPHRVNSIGKLKDVWNDGIRSFEVDVYFDSKAKHFQIGHEPDDTHINLESFLSTIENRDIEKVWLDLKNLDEDNCEAVIEHLNYLDNRFNIKSRIIVESSIKSPVFKKIREEGWHTSYYAPTTTIVNLLKAKDDNGMRQLANELAKQTKFQGVAAISFDVALYPFIKKYLEPLLTADIVYHAWDLRVGLYSNNLEGDLKEKVYYKDERIKTILLPFDSPFLL